MFNFIYRRWLVGKKIRDYERQALAHEFEASEIFLDIRNCKGLIDAEKEDIKANEDDIKQDEFDIDKIKKASDQELFDMYYLEQLENGVHPDEIIAERGTGEFPAADLIDRLRKERNETIQKLQQGIKNLKAANEGALQRISEREAEMRGLRDAGSGKVIKPGHNSRYQGHIAAAQKARIHADELRKFLRKTHANKIKLADDKPPT